jgi:two-component system, OmpR family, response regulator RegX3
VTRVLVVEDEESFSDALSYVLRKEGFEVALAATGPAALDEYDRAGADLVLLDLMLPGLPGTEVCRQLRQRSNVPVIMLTAKDSEVDKVVGLELGADDYVTKPFSSRELVARVRAVLRRARGPLAAAAPDGLAGPGPAGTYADGDLEVDVPARQARLRGDVVALTAREFELLAFLVRHPRQAFRREEILEQVWGYRYGDTSTVTVHVRRLREKIEPDPANPVRIATVWGVGYRWEGAGSAVTT